MEHGTRNSYTTRGCRCTACRAANADYQRERYQTRADVREQVQAYQEHRRREAGVLPRQPASPPEVLRERQRLRDRASRMEETIEQREQRRAARRAQVAQANDEERRHRLELQRARNLAFRTRKADTYRQAA
jgi:hypothetical protein